MTRCAVSVGSPVQCKQCGDMGTTMYVCVKCGGQGRDPFSNVQCDACSGTGEDYELCTCSAATELRQRMEP